jgi:hypothetical protein
VNASAQVTSEMIRDWFIDLIDTFSSISERAVAPRLRERVHGEIYRRERDHYPEWIDVGGES